MYSKCIYPHKLSDLNHITLNSKRLLNHQKQHEYRKHFRSQQGSLLQVEINIIKNYFVGFISEFTCASSCADTHMSDIPCGVEHMKVCNGGMVPYVPNLLILS